LTLTVRDDRVQPPGIDREVVTAAAASSMHDNTKGTDALLWLELAEGTTRAALVERLAQAHLSADACGVAHVPLGSSSAGMFEEL